MLVITRGEGESITIVLPDGRELRVYAGRIKEKGIRLGFEAPEDIKIYRNDEEQVIERYLRDYRRTNNFDIEIADHVFIQKWMGMKFEQLNGDSVRMFVRKQPKRVREAWLLLKGELDRCNL